MRDTDEGPKVDSFSKTGNDTLKFDDSLMETSCISKNKLHKIDHETLRKFKAYAPTIELNKMMNARIIRR